MSAIQYGIREQPISVFFCVCVLTHTELRSPRDFSSSHLCAARLAIRLSTISSLRLQRCFYESTQAHSPNSNWIIATRTNIVLLVLLWTTNSLWEKDSLKKNSKKCDIREIRYRWVWPLPAVKQAWGTTMAEFVGREIRENANSCPMWESNPGPLDYWGYALPIAPSRMSRCEEGNAWNTFWWACGKWRQLKSRTDVETRETVSSTTSHDFRLIVLCAVDNEARRFLRAGFCCVWWTVLINNQCKLTLKLKLKLVQES